jgi:two-component system response regulator GlrR
MECAPIRVLLLADTAASVEHRELLTQVIADAGLEPVLRDTSLAGADGEWVDPLRGLVFVGRPAAILLLCGAGTLDCGSISRLLRCLPPAAPVIVAGQSFDSAQVCSLFAVGVADFVLPPFTAAAVLPRIWRLVNTAAAPSPSPAGPVPVDRVCPPQFGLHGQSPAFLAAIEKLPSMARCDVTVMISGETGTGKELIERAIHYLSPRHDEPFVPIDCGAIPSDLAESELFGHERGAFTGAATRSPGLIASARRGTVFLDEVQALPLSVQAKLLRFLQEHEYRALGSSEVRRADVRILSASNCDLRDQVRRGEFREDLFYRLNVIHVQLPALRDRLDDVVLLTRHFIAKHAARFHRPAPDVAPAALDRLLVYAWPGNVRELEHVLEAAVVMCEGNLIDAGDLPPLAASRRATASSFREAKAQAVQEFERDYIIRVLRASGGNITAAARAAKKNRRAFWELLRKYQLGSRSFAETTTRRKAAPATEACAS